MTLYVHYQERSDGEMLTDTVYSLDYFSTDFFDAIQTEHFLNTVGQWSNNWSWTEQNKDLDVRVKYVVSGENVEDYMKRHNLKLNEYESRLKRQSEHG